MGDFIFKHLHPVYTIASPNHGVEFRHGFNKVIPEGSFVICPGEGPHLGRHESRHFVIFDVIHRCGKTGVL